MVLGRKWILRVSIFKCVNINDILASLSDCMAQANNNYLLHWLCNFLLRYFCYMRNRWNKFSLYMYTVPVKRCMQLSPLVLICAKVSHPRIQPLPEENCMKRYRTGQIICNFLSNKLHVAFSVPLASLVASLIKEV